MKHLGMGVLGAVAILGGCASSGPTVDEQRVRVERQLNELYRPLLAMIGESKASVEDFMATKLGRDWIFPLEKPEEVKAWLQKAEGDLMPRNERMCALIRAKRDLVDGPELPATWTALLVHQDGWRALHEKYKKDGVAYSWHSPTPFPRRLQPELEESIKALEARLAGLNAPR